MARILLIEDEQLLRQAIERVLRTRGHTVYSAWSVEGAIKSLRVERDIDVVLLDIFLNGSREHGGFRVAGRVPRDIPIIVISGGDERAIRAEAARNPLTGVVHWMAKPFEMADLAELVESYPTR